MTYTKYALLAGLATLAVASWLRPSGPVLSQSAPALPTFAYKVVTASTDPAQLEEQLNVLGKQHYRVVASACYPTGAVGNGSPACNASHIIMERAATQAP
jgi:hypothetical protein